MYASKVVFMKCEQILEIIDEQDFFELEDSARARLEEHCRSCDTCSRAAAAARVTSAMLVARAESAKTFDPSPFFGTKVMAAIRSKASRRVAGEAFIRWWQASYSTVSVMVVLVLFLVVGAALAPRKDEEAGAATPSNLYPTETVLIDHRPSRELNKEQVFQVIYNTRYEARK